MIVTGGHLQVPACCLSAAGNAVSGKGRQRIMTETKDYVRKVQYYETDRMGIVHHSNYIRWMEEARTDVLEQIGLPYDKIERAGILIPVLGVSCDYRISFRYSEVFRVKVIPEKFNGIKIEPAVRNIWAGGWKAPCSGGDKPLLPGQENETGPYEEGLS